MNLIAIDVGNSHISLALFLDNEEKELVRLTKKEVNPEQIGENLESFWNRIPVNPISREQKRDGVIAVSSVKPEWTQMLEEECDERIGEKIKLIGRDIKLPIEMGVDEPEKVGTDRVVSAAAAFAVVEDALIVADFGTAVTVDLVDEGGVFLGGVIAPGFGLGAQALGEGTAQLPDIDFQKPISCIGTNTQEAIRAGLYFSAVGLLKTISEEFAMQLGRWPQLIVTGTGAKVIKEHCDFVDSWVPSLVVRGVFLAYAKHVSDKAEMAEIVEKIKHDPREN